MDGKQVNSINQEEQGGVRRSRPAQIRKQTTEQFRSDKPELNYAATAFYVHATF